MTMEDRVMQRAAAFQNAVFFDGDEEQVQKIIQLLKESKQDQWMVYPNAIPPSKLEAMAEIQKYHPGDGDLFVLTCREGQDQEQVRQATVNLQRMLAETVRTTWFVLPHGMDFRKVDEAIIVDHSMMETALRVLLKRFEQPGGSWETFYINDILSQLRYPPKRVDISRAAIAADQPSLVEPKP